MIKVILLLVVSYLVYMLRLVVQDAWSLTIILLLLAGYIMFFAVITKKPEYSLYGFLLIFLFFPKGGNNFRIFRINELYGASLSSIIQCAAACAICVRMLRVKKIALAAPRNLLRFCTWASFLVIISFVFSLLGRFFGDYWGNPVKAEELIWSSQLLYGVIFLYGCIFFVADIRKIEKVFVIMILSGIDLILETILYFYLRLPLPHIERVINKSGRFTGFVFCDFVTLALVCFAAIACVLYFIFSRKKYVYLLTVPLFFLPIIATYQRGSLAAGVLVIIVFFVLYFNLKLPRIIVIGLLISVFALGTSLFVKTEGMNLSKIKLLFQGKSRPDYFTSVNRTFQSRVGAYLRGLDVFIFSMPFGVGPERVPQCMANSSVPNYFGLSYGHEDELRHFYWLIYEGNASGPHNFYINFIAEYGLFGVFAIFFFLFCFIFNLRLLRKNGNRLKNDAPNFFLIKVTSNAVLFGIGLWFIGYHYIFYWMFFLFFFLTFFIPQNAGESGAIK
jgi:hypothetical protein